MLVVSLISWVVVLAAYVVALVVCWARALQLYIMAAFAPIPLAFLGMDATRQIGLGYLKSFGAVCIAGVIILVLLISFPLVLGGLGRRGRERAHLRAAVPGHVRAAHPGPREERLLGARHRERLLAEKRGRGRSP